jgi:hypothetical protein
MKIEVDVDVIAAILAERDGTTEWDYDVMQELETHYGLESAIQKVMEEKHGIDFDEYMC